MKRFYILIISFVLGAWALGLYIFHAGPSIHTLIGLAILICLHNVLSICDPGINRVKLQLNVKYYWYIRLLKKGRRLK